MKITIIIPVGCVPPAWWPYVEVGGTGTALLEGGGGMVYHHFYPVDGQRGVQTLPLLPDSVVSVDNN